MIANALKYSKGWFSRAHKHNASITSENTHDISVSISRNIRRTNPLICLMLFSLAHKHKHKRISISISARKTNMFVFLVLILCLCASENSIRQISGFVPLMFLLMLTLMSWVFSLVMLMLCLCASENQP